MGTTSVDCCKIGRFGARLDRTRFGLFEEACSVGVATKAFGTTWCAASFTVFFFFFIQDKGFGPFGPFLFFGGRAINSAALASRSFNAGNFGNSQFEGFNFWLSLALAAVLDTAEASSIVGTGPFNRIKGTPGTCLKFHASSLFCVATINERSLVFPICSQIQRAAPIGLSCAHLIR